MKLRRLLPLLLLTGLAGAVAGLFVAHMLTQRTIALQGGTALPEPRTLRPFLLSDTAGRAFANQALRGHPTLLYFGFTSCPDVCPTTLAMLRDLRRQALPAGLQVLFVSVDPERDTPAVLAQYLAAFSNEFIGLRPAPGALAPLLRNLSAFAGRKELPGGQHAFDHSATLYLLDTQGRLAAVFTPPFTAAAMGADLRTLASEAAL